MTKTPFREIANKKASHDYTITDTIEAGMKLTSETVKAIRANNFNLTGNYIKVLGERVMMIGEHTTTVTLLLHKRQINSLIGTIQQDGMTIVPLKVYEKRGKFKLLIGVAKGKRDFDKRAADKQRTVDNDVRRVARSQTFGEY